MVLVAAAATTSDAFAQRVNFAKYQAVTASAQTQTYLADFATDGFVSNFHSLRSGNQLGPFWVEISCPRHITIASAHLYTGLLETATPSQVLASFRFQYHNGTSWIDIPGSTVNANTQTELPVTFSAPVTASRFRLYSTSNGSFTIREIAFFPPNIIGGMEQGFPIGTDVNVNLAYKRPATSSSAHLDAADGPGFAKNAVDGYLDNRSRWLVNPTNGVYSSGEALEVDLLSTNMIGSAHVYSGTMDANRASTSPIPDFRLEYLSGGNWTPIPGAAVANNTSASLRVQFSSSVPASRVRLVTTSANPARLQELLLFPPRTGGYPLGQEVTDAPPPTTTWDRYSDSSHRIRNGGPDLCLGVINGAAANVPADDNNTQQTEWQLLLNHRDGSYRVRHAGTGLCLALAQISTAADIAVTAEEYTGLPHQDWRLVFIDATNFRLVNVYSGLALQPAAGAWSPGTALVVRPVAANNATQTWSAEFRRHYPKKGIAGTGNPSPFNSAVTIHQDYYTRLGGSWSYTWGRQVSSNFPYIGVDHAVSPMQWGNFNWTHTNTATAAPMERNHRDIQSTPKPVYLMGFNEPDKTDQGYIIVEEAIMRWPRLEARDAPLVAPAPAQTFSAWNTNFVAAADSLGYRRDYTSVHWYAGPNATSLINHLGQAYTNFGRPVWLTEFSTVRWDSLNSTARWTDADNFNFLAEFMWRAESIPWIKRYSIFVFTDNTITNNPPEAPRGNTLRADGSLTAFGELYASWDGVTNTVINRAYHLHGYGAYRRGQNPGGISAPASVSPSNNVAGIQWTIRPGATADAVRIISTRDGRPLRCADGINVTFGTNGETGAPVEWRLQAAEYGLQFIHHPASSQKRLLLDTNGTFSMAASNTTTGPAKWRFVPALNPEPAAPPPAPSTTSVVAAGNTIAISWTPVPGALNYTLQRSNSVWETIAPGLTDTSWTDTGLASGGTFSYRVIALNLIDPSDPSTPSAATILPAAPLVTATAATGSITLTWGVVAGATGYNIQRFDLATGQWAIAAAGVAGTTWTDAGLPAGTTRRYRVAAFNVSGSSAPSAEVEATTPADEQAPDPVIVRAGTAGFDGTTTSVTHDFLGLPNRTWTLEFTGEIGMPWTSHGAVTSAADGTLSATFTKPGDHTDDWNGSMFFRAVRPAAP